MSFIEDGCDAMFDFDFEDLIDFTQADDSSSSNQTITLSTKRDSKKTVKAKRETKVIVSKKIHPFLGVGESKPNVSRRNISSILYAFPHFDKADALLYFPNTFTRHMNSGDFPSLTKLIMNHIDKRCEVSVHDEVPLMNGHTVLQMLFLIHDLRPDLIMCVHETKVIENQIYASAYAKATDVTTVYDSVGGGIASPLFREMFAKQRKERFHDALQRVTKTQSSEEMNQIEALMISGADLLMYSAVDMVLTFDDVSKKIKHLKIHSRITSLHPSEHTYDHIDK